MERPVSTSDGTRGFTLIELMIAVAVLSVLAVGATLVLARSNNSQGSEQALFLKTHDTLRALAIAAQHVTGLRVEPRGMYTGQYGPDGWDMAANRITWARRVDLNLPTSQLPRNRQDSQILYLPNGQSTPFTVLFGDGVQCRNDGWGPLTCDG